MFHALECATLDDCQRSTFSNFAKSLIHFSWTFVYFRNDASTKAFFCFKLTITYKFFLTYIGIFSLFQSLGRGILPSIYFENPVSSHNNWHNIEIYIFLNLQAIGVSVICSLLGFDENQGCDSCAAKGIFRVEHS